jgi:hypothetical protein
MRCLTAAFPLARVAKPPDAWPPIGNGPDHLFDVKLLERVDIDAGHLHAGKPRTRKVVSIADTRLDTQAPRRLIKRPIHQRVSTTLVTGLAIFACRAARALLARIHPNSDPAMPVSETPALATGAHLTMSTRRKAAVARAAPPDFGVLWSPCRRPSLTRRQHNSDRTHINTDERPWTYSDVFSLVMPADSPDRGSRRIPTDPHRGRLTAL